MRTSTRDYMGRFLIDDTEGERRRLEAWMTLYFRQIERLWARDG